MILVLQAECWVEVNTNFLESNIFTQLTLFILIDKLEFANLNSNLLKTLHSKRLDWKQNEKQLEQEPGIGIRRIIDIF